MISWFSAFLLAAFWFNSAFAEANKDNDKDLEKNKSMLAFACNADMALSNYVAGAVTGSGNAAVGLSDKEKAQVDAALKILNGEANKHLTKQDKYKAVMDLCAEGRILKNRFEHLHKE